MSFRLDRLCSLFGGADSIRDLIAFPENNLGCDVIIDSSVPITNSQIRNLSHEADTTSKL